MPPAAAPQAHEAARALVAPRYGEGSGWQRRPGLLVAIAALHLLGFWGLSRVQDVKRALVRRAPVVVRLLAPVEPPRPQPPVSVAAPQWQAPALPRVEPPLVAVAAPPAPSPVVAALPPPPPAPVAPQAQAAPAPVAPPVVTPPAPSLKRLPASAVRYVREPRMVVPLMSKRLRESGVVHLRVVVDVNGLPKEITLAKSSGFARLDEQALQDMRSARFAPYTENGQPIEWEVIAPMSYEVER